MGGKKTEPRVDRRLWAFVGFLAIALGGIIAAVLYAMTVDRPWNKSGTAETRPDQPTSRVARLSTREAGRAFRDGAVRPTYEECAPFVDLFADIATAIGEQDADLFFRRVNLSAWQELVGRQADGKEVRDDDSRHAAQGMVLRFVLNGPGAGDANFELCRIRRAEIGGVTSAVVYTRRQVFNLKSVARQVWWLREQEGIWEVIDLSDVGTGLRASTVAAECVRDNVPETTLAALMNYLPSVMEDEYSLAAKALESVRGVPLPPSLDGFRAYLELDAAQRMPWLFDQHDIDAGFKRLEELAPRMPALAGRRSRQCLFEEQYDEALQHVERYTRTLGVDRGILMVKARSLAALTRTDEAIAVHRQALGDNPYATDHITELAKLLPDERSSEVVAEFRRIPEATDWFSTLAGELLTAEELVDLEAVVDAMREMGPRAPTINYYHGEVLRRREEYAAAAETYAAAFDRVQDEEQLQYYVTGFVSSMMADLRAEDAYGRAPLPRFAFEQVADRLTFPQNYLDEYADDCEFVKSAGAEAAQQARRHALYRTVANRHLPIDPEDPWLAYYDGQLAIHEQRYDDAERIFADAGEQETDDRARESIRLARIFACYLGGRDEIAYEQVAPQQDTFEQLAIHCEGDQQWGRLQALVERRRRDAPENPMLDYYSGIAAKGQGRSDDAIRDLEAFVAKAEIATAEQDDASAVDAADLVIGRNALIRALVKARRWDDAIAQNRRLDQPGFAAFNELYIHAAKGDVTAAEAVMSRCLELVGIATLYEDQDLGPILRSDAFKELREKYPEPKPEPSARD